MFSSGGKDREVVDKPDTICEDDQRVNIQGSDWGGAIHVHNLCSSRYRMT